MGFIVGRSLIVTRRKFSTETVQQFRNLAGNVERGDAICKRSDLSRTDSVSNSIKVLVIGIDFQYGETPVPQAGGEEMFWGILKREKT